MHLQKLRSSSVLRMPSTRQRNDGLHENQSETPISSLIFPTSGSHPMQYSKSTRALAPSRIGKLFKTAAFAAVLAAFTAPQVLTPQAAYAKPSAKPVGTWGRTTGSSTYIRIRPGTQTPIVAKVAKGTQLMVWGTFNGWYRVETTDHKFGWIYHDLVDVPNAKKLKTLSHAKAKAASDRTGHQVLYGNPAVLKKYYATYKAPGAKIGLAKQGISLTAKKPAAKPAVKVVAKPKPKPAMPREVTIVTAEPKAVEATVTQPKAVEAKVVTPVVRTVPAAKPVKATALVSRKTTTRTVRSTPNKRAVPLEATTIEPMSPSKLPQITPADIMNARRAHIQGQLTSRHKTRPSATKSRSDSTIKTAPAAKPVKPTKAKFQPTSAEAIVAELNALDLTDDEKEVLGEAYFQASAKKKPAAAPSRGGSPRDYARQAQKKGQLGGSMANQALSYRGMPYIRGASSPSRGFDCSGLIYYLLRSRGYNPPRTAAGLAKYGKSVARKDLKPGDLVLFANTYKRGVSHIGIYIGNNNFVHAANRRSGVKTDSLSSAYYSKKYYGARRVQ